MRRRGEFPSPRNYDRLCPWITWKWGAMGTSREKAEYPVMDKYEYATTSPVYVTIGGKRAYAREDAEYFKAWIERTIEVTEKYPDWNSAAEKELVMKRLREARGVYEGMK